MEPSIPPRENRDPLRSQRRTVKLALLGGIKEFPAESRFKSWLRRIGDIAALPVYGGEYALYAGRRRVFGIGLGIAGLAVLLAFVPHLRWLVWPLMAWTILVVSAIVVLGVAVNILVAVVSMYTGYSPASDEFRSTGDSLSDVHRLVAPFEERGKVADEWVGRWEDVLYDLRSAEYALFNLERSSAFETFTGKQKGHYNQVLQQVQALVRDISNESTASHPEPLVTANEVPVRRPVRTSCLTLSARKSGLPQAGLRTFREDLNCATWGGLDRHESEVKQGEPSCMGGAIAPLRP